MRASPPRHWILGIVGTVASLPGSSALAGSPASVASEPAGTFVAAEPGASRWVFRHGGDGAMADPADPPAKVPYGGGPQAIPLSVIEIPSAQLPGMGRPARAHHALSMRFDAAERAMRSMGLDATECRLQFRAPTKLSQTGGGISVDAMAQLRFACRF